MTEEEPIFAGGCKIGRLLGVGGMAVVYEATHVASGEAVAIKLISREGEPQDRDDFAREVRAIARLDHPGIIGILDAGELDEPRTISRRTFEAGTPFLVMERATDGTFSGRDVDSWADVKRVLIQVLDALAHAHALGIVHRDIKPANLLLHGGRCKLSDFGIVRLADSSETKDRRIVGTPAYMAPEQIEGLVRAQGPWTDVYSVGILAWEMLTGQRPFEGDNLEILNGHLRRPLPALTPRFAVPEGLEEWLHQMLVKLPRGRFQRAADAANAVANLGRPTGEAISKTPSMDELPTETLILTELPTAVDVGTLGAGGLSEPEEPPRPPSMSRVPHTWQRPGARGQRRLANAGLGLFGLRSIPMVDRDGERTDMWQEFQTCFEQQQPRAIVLRGPSGVGKTRLAEWIVRRAHELGCAEVLRAAQTELDDPGVGLGRMLADFFDARGLEATDARVRVRDCLAHHRYDSQLDAETFTDMLTGRVSRSTQPFQLTDDADALRFAAVGRLLSHLAEVRPVIVWIDDAHADGDLVRFANATLQGGVSGAVLFVLTSLETSDSGSETGLTAVDDADNIRNITVPPLSPTYIRSLAATTLGLEPELSDIVAANAGGMPLAAIQTIADWVDQNDLVAGPSGYRLRDASLEKTGTYTLSDVWIARLESAFQSAKIPVERGHHAMAIGALLGRRISFIEWTAATGLDREQLTDLARAMYDAGLATPTQRGMLLSYERLRSALIARQNDDAVLRRNHLACAAALRSSDAPDEDDAARLQRIARHLEAAGEPAKALLAMVESLELFAGRFEVLRADELRRAAGALIKELGHAPDSPEALRVALVEVTLLQWQKRYEEAQAIAHDCLQLSTQAGLKELRARSLLALSHSMFSASVASLNERRDDAALYAEQAATLLGQLGDEEGAARAYAASAYAHLRAGDGTAAYDAARKATSLSNVDGASAPLAHYLLGTIERTRGHDDEAFEHFERAIQLSLRGGVRFVLAGAYNGRGDILRFRGEHDEALRSYDDAALLWENLESPHVNTARINAALASIAMSDYESAKRSLESVLESKGTEAGYESIFASTFILPCLAAEHDEERYDEVWERATTALSDLGIVDRDVMTSFEIVESLWRERGDTDRAEAAARVVDAQREKLTSVN